MTRLLYFSAKWCAPCKIQWPTTERVANQLSIPIEKIDIESNLSLAKEYEVLSIPTLVIFTDGKETARHVGRISEDLLREALVSRQ